jgi:cysteine synthase B
MVAYGAELILVSEATGMEGARDLANTMEKEGRGKQLDQFSNRDNSGAHINVCSAAVCETSMIASTLVASNILGKYAFGQRRMPAIFVPIWPQKKVFLLAYRLEVPCLLLLSCLSKWTMR